MPDTNLQLCCKILMDTEDLPPVIRNNAQALRNDPTNEDLTVGLVRVLCQIGAYNAAQKVLELQTAQTESFRVVRALLLGACFIIDGHDQRAQNELEDVPVPDLGQPMVREAVEDIFQIANDLFNQRNFELSRRVYNWVVPLEPRLIPVSDGSLGKKTDWKPSIDPDIESLRETIEECFRNKESVLAKKPAMAQYSDAVSTQDIESLAGKKLLLLMREHCWGEQSRIWEPVRNCKVTASELGLELRSINIDSIVFGGERADEKRMLVLSELKDVVDEFQPDFVVVDNLGMDIYENALESEFARLFVDTLRKLRDENKFWLVGMYADAWEPKCTEAIEYVAPSVDALWYLNYSVFLKLPESAQAKSVVLPFPYIPPLQDNPFTGQRPLEAAFMGSSKRYNALRSLWFLAMEDAEIPFELILTDPIQAPGRLQLTDEEYANKLASMKTCIHFSGRNLRAKIICGRVWESLFAGCTLVEEENLDTKALLVPYLHYLPFASLRDLAVATECLRQYPDLQSMIAREGHAWATEKLCADRIWARVLTDKSSTGVTYE